MGARPCHFSDDSWLKVWHSSAPKSGPKVMAFVVHKTKPVASRPINILHMGLMNDSEDWFLLLVVHGCQAMSFFKLKLAESLALIITQILTKSDGICGLETIPVAYRPFNILHMGLMSDAEEWFWLLVVHGCQTMPIFQCQLAESLALISEPGPKVMAFVVTKPNQLPTDPSICSF
jgi:hypothetical protein